MVRSKGDIPSTNSPSLGGVVGSCASKGYSAKQRARQGRKGGIMAIIYVSAFALPFGESLFNKLGNEWPPWMKGDVCNSALCPHKPSNPCRVRRCTSIKVLNWSFPTFQSTSRRNGMLALPTLLSEFSKVLRHMSHGKIFPAHILSARGIQSSYRSFKRLWPIP
jgi:hypothetical protein